jgi:membrane protease YdiL (CAAX protease family)
MEKRIKYLKVFYTIEIIIAVLLAIFVAFTSAILGNGAPGTGVKDMILAGGIGFLFIAIPGILLPIFAKKELDNFNEKRKLPLNIINTIIFLFVFIPVSIWQFYMLYRLYKD